MGGESRLVPQPGCSIWRRKISSTKRDSNLGPPSPQPSHYTNHTKCLENKTYACLCSLIYFTTILLAHKILQLFLGAFTKLRKATISFVMSVCPACRLLSVSPSVCLHGKPQLPLDGFSCNFIWVILENTSSSSSSSCSWRFRRVSCSLILKMMLVPPSLPRSSYVPSSFWFILQCLFW